MSFVNFIPWISKVSVTKQLLISCNEVSFVRQLIMFYVGNDDVIVWLQAFCVINVID